MQHDKPDADPSDRDLSDLAAQLLQAIASEPVPPEIDRLARELQAALDRRVSAATAGPAQQGPTESTAD